mmetsp:Transcript_45356/g.119056  ORF Transcript_45356/g.119056 Transcript_45356/m.119056 type:complete len:228 (+) Transcript_45356:563-1246(+)
MVRRAVRVARLRDVTLVAWHRRKGHVTLLGGVLLVARLGEGDRTARARPRLAVVAPAVLLNRCWDMPRVARLDATNHLAEIGLLGLRGPPVIKGALVHTRLHVHRDASKRRHVEHVVRRWSVASVAWHKALDLLHVHRKRFRDDVLRTGAALLRAALLGRGVRVRIQPTVRRTGVLVTAAGHVPRVPGTDAVDQELVVWEAVNLALARGVDGHRKRRRQRNSASLAL